jgi:hypothetical protein
MRRHYRRAALAACAALIVFAACSRNKGPETEPEPRPDPIPVHVKNENFLDMNIFVVTSGISRRLGTVSGNASGDFLINWSVANGQTVTITASPIGGRGGATSGALSVGIGQVIDFKIGSTLRQSVASVHDPR